MKPARPAREPQSTKAKNTIRWEGNPAFLAASGIPTNSIETASVGEEGQHQLENNDHGHHDSNQQTQIEIANTRQIRPGRSRSHSGRSAVSTVWASEYSTNIVR